MASVLIVYLITGKKIGTILSLYPKKNEKSIVSTETAEVCYIEVLQLQSLFVTQQH